MPPTRLSTRTEKALQASAPVIRFFTQSAWARRGGKPGACDFTIGNPHEMPPPALVDALQRWIVPKDARWFAYKQNEPAARAAAAEALRRRRQVAFEAEDIFLTTGATAGLAVVLGAIVDPGEEVIFVSPPWFQYEGMIVMAGGVPVRARLDLESFDLDIAAIERALTDRTRAVIVNSPHNPTGRIYPPETLGALAELLTRAGEHRGRPLYLISDEAYSRILFDGRTYPSPTAFYPSSFLVYTYSKVLLAPGQRIGYVALPPEMPDRPALRAALQSMQMLLGWCFPNALLQYALEDLEGVSIDLAHLQRKRDRLVGALRGMGYTVPLPEATFYVLVRSPLADDEAFTERLAEHDVFVMPGATMELPGYFRLAITASDEEIERALPAFAAALEKASGKTT